MNPLILTIFGITGNLSQIKLIPTLYDMEEKGLLENVKILGNARRPQSRQEFVRYLEETILDKKPQAKKELIKRLIDKMFYIDGHLDDSQFYFRLKEELERLSRTANKIFYLATYPELYKYIFENLAAVSLNQQGDNWTRLMIEKPFGNDLSSAQELNKLISQYFSPDQVYRIDHYLGKETVQNILTFRFGNGLFEPLFNKDYIDHIQITVAEDFGVQNRGGYYDSIGALRDVGQNHHLQILSFITMDAPETFTAEAVARERLKVLNSLKIEPDSLVLGQYEGYRQEVNVFEQSQTDTFYSFKTEVQNDRFAGVPIYLRGGKKLQQSIVEVSIVFKIPDNRLFKNHPRGMEPNILQFRIQPDEQLSLQFLSKKPDHKFDLKISKMHFKYQDDDESRLIPDPYEKLLFDVLSGNQTFFNTTEETEAQWNFIDQLIKEHPLPILYKPESWGPEKADQIIKDDGREWFLG